MRVRVIPGTVNRRVRPRTAGKFIHVHGEPFLVRGVTYGTFMPRRDGQLYPERDQIRRDLRLMALAGINTLRTYTAPPQDLLDAAAEHGLYVIAGLAWPQHVAFLDDAELCADIRRGIRRDMRAIARHPALLLTAIGNEIPPSIVRWHGQGGIERFLRDLCDEARQTAPDELLTYVNYPPTEYLELPFIDVHAFNVFLHDEAALRTYVAHLHHIAAGSPLLLTECGADSRRHREDGQAALASMQVAAAFNEGACGAVVFAWTDEWWRGGTTIDDWSFGLVDKERKPKAAYAAVTNAFRTAPFQNGLEDRWPTVSVVVCAYNAAATIDQCLATLERPTYPSVELIVVDDGSTDDTAALARAHPSVRLIQTSNNGLSAARNVGMQAAVGEVIAYVDADVRVEPSWLTYLVRPFIVSDAVASGGPNVVPADDAWFAQCVARAPGAPAHVLFDDRLAEHVPGCNFAVRRSALLAIGGFDPIFHRAGDDVDVCWRLQDAGGCIAFAPSALVWHQHRARLSSYWRQQVGYGEGEAWLRRRHSARFSGSRVAWRGRIYSPLPFVRSLTASRLHSGVWGTAAFPSVYQTNAHPLRALPHTLGWQLTAIALLLGGLVALAIRGAGDATSLAMVGALAGGLTLFRCGLCAWRSDIDDLPPLPHRSRRMSRGIYRSVIAMLHLVQPAARAYGYARGLLHPPSVPATNPIAPVEPAKKVPRDWTYRIGLLMRGSGSCCFWGEAWTSGGTLLGQIVDRLRVARLRGGIIVDDGWQPDRDVSVALSLWAWAHLKVVVEEHGGGRCLFRARIEIRPRLATLTLMTALIAAGWLAATAGALGVASVALCGIATFGAIAWSVSRDAGQVLDIVSAVATESGMQQMPAADGRSRERHLDRETQLAGVLAHKQGLSRDTVGD